MNNKENFAMNIALFRTLKIGLGSNETVSRSEMSFLVLILNAKKEITSVDLSHYFGCSKVFVSKVINMLSSKKLVEKVNKDNDRRSFIINITDEGKKLTKEYIEEYVKETSYLYEKLGEEKANTLNSLLDESRKILDNYGK